MTTPTVENFITALQLLRRSGLRQEVGTFAFEEACGGHGFRASRLGYFDEGIRYFPRNKTMLRRMAQSFAEREAPPVRGPMMRDHSNEEE